MCGEAAIGRLGDVFICRKFVFDQNVGTRHFMRVAHSGRVHLSVSSLYVSAAHFAIAAGIPYGWFSTGVTVVCGHLGEGKFCVLQSISVAMFCS